MGKKHIDENPGKFTFSKIASTLSMDYESIFVISAEDDSYAEYSISGSDNELVVRSSGDDFYADLVEITKERVYQDDQ